MVPLVHPCNGSIILRVLTGSPVEMWLKAILRFHLQPNRINQHRACIKFHDATSLRSYMMECTFSGLRSYVFRVYSRSAMEGIVFLLFNLMDGKAHIWPNEHKNSLIVILIRLRCRRIRKVLISDIFSPVNGNRDVLYDIMMVNWRSQPGSNG